MKSRILFTIAGLATVAWIGAFTGCASTSPGKKTSTPTTAPSGPTNTPTMAGPTNTPMPPTATPTPPCTQLCVPTAMAMYTPVGNECIVPQQTPQTAANLTFAANSWYTYRFPATTGVQYTFTVCSSGGSHTGDTMFFIYDTASCPGMYLAFNDDLTGCSFGSQIVWTSTVTGDCELLVNGYNWSAVSAMTLAYWRN